MAQRGWTRQGALALFVLSAALLGGCGRPEGEPGRQFNSRLPFRVWAEVEEGDDPTVLGETPSEKPLAIPACRRWWVEVLGRPYMAAIVRELDAQRIPGLDLASGASDDDLSYLRERRLRGLQTLYLYDTQTTDVGLAYIKGLKGLQRLMLNRTQVTDTGLTQLRGLKRLQLLGLANTRVTDAGLAHLRRLGELRALNLWATEVTDAGLAHLKGLKGLRELDLALTEVTDAGLVHLKELKGLQSLELHGTKVTDTGIAELKKSLPNVTVFGPRSW